MTDLPDLVAPWSSVPLVNDTTKLLPEPTMTALDAHTAAEIVDPASTIGGALSATIASESEPVAGRAIANGRRQAPGPLSSPDVTSPTFTAVIGMLPDGLTKVFTNSGFSAAQIGISTDGVSFTWGENFGSANIATGFIQTPDGEVLVAVKARDNLTPGTLRRSTGWNPATADATSWATVLTASENGAHMDGRWCLTERSIARSESAGAGALFVNEYDGDNAWMSTDDGVTWTQIFDLQVQDPGATHMHGIAYDPWDDRVWVSAGDTAYAGIYYTDRATIDGMDTVWTLLPGSDSSAWQVTTIIPLAAGVVFLSDATTSGAFAVPRNGYRGYGALYTAVSLVGSGLIGAHAYQAADDLPAYLTFYQSGSGQTPKIIATIDGKHFSTVHTDASTVTSGPGIHSIVGPDLNGYLWAARNLTGTGALLRLTALAASADVPTSRQVIAGAGLTGGGALTGDVTLTAVGSQSPIRRGLIGHTGAEELFANTSVAITGGTHYLMKIVAETDAASATRNVRVFQVGAATGLTSWVAAVFDSTGAQLGSTSSSDAGSATSHRNFACGSFALVKGQEYYVSLLFIGTTGPTLARSAASAQVRMGLSGAALLYATGGTALGAMPSSITPSALTNLDIALWAGLY